ncbi:MAG: TRAM domain-containing protein [Actinomycetota bacterium]|nr:TRAM domain-containing protein [Actinomycetota bacterium]
MEEVEILRPASGGGVARLEDGKTIFVRNSIDGERVRVRIDRERSKVAFGSAIEVIETSKDRVTPKCLHYGVDECGGCDLQHMNYAHQLQWKEAIVASALRKFSDVIAPIVSVEEDQLRFRTRIRLRSDEDGRASFDRRHSNDPIAIDDCVIADERFSDAFRATWPENSSIELRGLDEFPFAVVKEDAESEEYMLFDLNGDEIEDEIVSQVTVNGQEYQVSAMSFWQSHRLAPQIISDQVLTATRGEHFDEIFELYCGVGLLSKQLIYVGGILGAYTLVESSYDALGDADENLSGYDDVELVQGRVDRFKFPKGKGSRLLVMDPPRSGLDSKITAEILRHQFAKIIYVSCDGSTLNRDLETLSERYDVTSITPLDLFPQTEHLEYVAVLEPKP